MHTRNIIGSSILLLVIALILFLILKTPAKAPIQSVDINGTGHVPIPSTGEYIVNYEKSVIRAYGQKPLIPGYTDVSTTILKNGFISVNNGIVSGEFKIDMNSIAIESTGKKTGESMLENHLKSKDFFNVVEFPESTFKVISAIKTVEDDLYTVSGNLTIKDLTLPITFPAVIYMLNGKLVTEGRIELNRTQWNIKYGSGTFFGNLGNNVISDIFTVEFKIVADAK